MNIKKILKEDNENVNKQILEEGQQTYNTLSQKFCVQSDGSAVIRRKNNKTAWIIALTCLLICVITAGVLWISIAKSNQPKYYKENEVIEDFELETVYKHINNAININSDEYILVSTTNAYDSVTQDNLYYSIEIKDYNNLISGYIYFVTNKNYDFTEKYPAEPSQTVWKNLNVKYASASHKLDILTTNEVFGCLEYNKIKVYFSYEQIDLDASSSPIQFLDSVLILK